MSLTKEQIEEGSKLIAEFMGAQYKEFDKCYHYAWNNAPTPDASYRWDIEHMQYHTSFDWIMPVCKDLAVLPIDILIRIDLQYALHECEIENIFICTVEAIKWYNEYKSKTT